VLLRHAINSVEIEYICFSVVLANNDSDQNMQIGC